MKKFHHAGDLSSSRHNEVKIDAGNEYAKAVYEAMAYGNRWAISLNYLLQWLGAGVDRIVPHRRSRLLQVPYRYQ